MVELHMVLTNVRGSLFAGSIPICRPSDPPRFKNLMEDYVNRCTGAISIKFCAA